VARKGGKSIAIELRFNLATREFNELTTLSKACVQLENLSKKNLTKSFPCVRNPKLGGSLQLRKEECLVECEQSHRMPEG